MGVIVMRKFDREYLRNLRKERRYSMEILARLIGAQLGGSLTRSSICHWEKGGSLPSVESLLAMSEIFEVPMDYFFVPLPNYLFVFRGERDGHKKGFPHQEQGLSGQAPGLPEQRPTSPAPDPSPAPAPDPDPDPAPALRRPGPDGVMESREVL